MSNRLRLCSGEANDVFRPIQDIAGGDEDASGSICSATTTVNQVRSAITLATVSSDSPNVDNRRTQSPIGWREAHEPMSRTAGLSTLKPARAATPSQSRRANLLWQRKPDEVRTRGMADPLEPCPGPRRQGPAHRSVPPLLVFKTGHRAVFHPPAGDGSHGRRSVPGRRPNRPFEPGTHSRGEQTKPTRNPVATLFDKLDT